MTEFDLYKALIVYAARLTEISLMDRPREETAPLWDKAIRDYVAVKLAAEKLKPPRKSKKKPA